MKGWMKTLLITAVLTLPLLGLGFYFQKEARDVEKNITVAAGKLKIVEPAKDDLFGIILETPLLFRSAEMYQHCFHGRDTGREDADGHKIYEYYVEDGFSSYREGTENAYDNPEYRGSTKRYANPGFPKDYEDKWNFAHVEIADTGIKVSERLLERFKTGGSMVEVPKSQLPENGGRKYDLMRVGDGVYATRKDENWEIGDLRTTFTMADPEVLDQGFTIVGKVDKKGYIGDDLEAMMLIGTSITEAEAMDRYREAVAGDGDLFFTLAGIVCVGSLVVGGICILLSRIFGRKKA